MIFEALAQTLGTPADVAQARCSGILQTLKGPPERLYATDLNSAILATYAIVDDTARLRAAAAAGDGAGAYFDRLRKHYPERREFEHYCLCSGDPTLDAVFNALGFNSHAACAV